jgi:hypothetical protein
VSSSEDKGSSDGDSDEEDENGPVEAEDPEALVAEWGVGAMAANPEEEIPLMDESKRCGRCCGGHSNWIGEKELCVQRKPGWIKSGKVHNMSVRCLMCMYSRPASAMIAMTSWMDGKFHYLPACRIAIVDLDWDHVKAVDIFAVLR